MSPAAVRDINIALGAACAVVFAVEAALFWRARRLRGVLALSVLFATLALGFAAAVVGIACGVNSEWLRVPIWAGIFVAACVTVVRFTVDRPRR